MAQPKSSTPATTPTSPPRPHVVLIFADQLRFDAVGFMGNPHVRTPNLDRLSRRGSIMQNTYCQAPSCLASRAAMLTGRYPRATRMAAGAPVLDPRETTLPETLQRNGYRTGVFGKLHLTPQQYTSDTLGIQHAINDPRVFLRAAGLTPPLDDPCKRSYGFQTDVAHEDTLWGDYLDWLKLRDPALAARMGPRPFSGWDGWHRPLVGKCPISDVGPTDIPLALHPSSFIAESARDFFMANHKQGPCLVNVSFVDPHHPFDPPAEMYARYNPREVPLPRFSDPGTLQWPASLRARMSPYAVTPEHTQIITACYYAMIDTLDAALGRVIDAVEQAGEMDNTLFVFMADHGELLGDYGLFRKSATHYESVLRVPAFFSWPGHVAQGARIDGLFSGVDLTPTILGLLGLPITPGIQGIDASGNLRDASALKRKWAFSECYLAKWGPFVDCYTLRTARAKLNYYPASNDRVGHLFDMQNDPGERHDLYGDPAHRPLRDEMMANLMESLLEQKDPLPLVISQY